MEGVRKVVCRRVRLHDKLTRELLAEFIGTAFLLLVGTGSVAQWLLSHQERNAWIGINLCWGLGVMFGAYICGGVSGGHMNPAVSVMAFVMGDLSFVRMLLYSVAQTAGAFFGALLTYLTYYDAINVHDGGIRMVRGENGTAGIFTTFPSPHISVWGAVLDQIVGTGILTLCVKAIGDKRNGNVPGFLHPLLAGLVVAMIGMCFGMNCGYPINPGRDLGPRILTAIIYGWEVFSYNNYTWFWIPLVGPTIGAVVGAWLYKLFIGLHWSDELEVVAVEEVMLLSKGSKVTTMT
uniref:Aquaporin 9 n=1 Tax=Plectus sambesii TaxID=2011161 RepID=A0A914VHM5_9BILA